MSIPAFKVDEEQIQRRMSDMPDRSEMAYLKFARAHQKIKDLGNRMAKEFDTLADAQDELKALGVSEISLALPEHVLTALSVYRRERERIAAESERRSR